MAAQPDSSLAQATLPEPLYEALVHVFAQGVSGCMLVGGTALAGYYAGHRRSDDLDLFVADGDAVTAVTLAVDSLRREGVEIDELQRTAQFYSAACRSREHRFTVQVVLDVNLFEVGNASTASDGVHVADLQTLLKTKAAALLSRCSEKDLYDLHWLFGRFPELNASDLIVLGAEIDGGMSAEALLISLVGAPLELASCGFAFTQTSEEVLRDVRTLKRRLESAFDQIAREQPAPPVGQLIRGLRASAKKP